MKLPSVLRALAAPVTYPCPTYVYIGSTCTESVLYWSCHFVFPVQPVQGRLHRIPIGHKPPCTRTVIETAWNGTNVPSSMGYYPTVCRVILWSYPIGHKYSRSIPISQTGRMGHTLTMYERSPDLCPVTTACPEGWIPSVKTAHE